jgi:transcriptional regulator with XRE-family HTH domain
MEAREVLPYRPRMMDSAQPIGALLREWRHRRRLSQLDLALDAGISARHLSFLETGRSRPSREMVLRLAERLDVPLRERNMLLTAAGFAPVFRERKLDDPALKAARVAVDLILAAHEPFPALAVDRHWTLVAANNAATRLLAGVAPALLQPPVNVLRLSLHQDGLAPRIRNFATWRAHILERLRRQVELTADRVLGALLTELRGYPAADGRQPRTETDHAGVFVPLELATEAGTLAFFSTTTVFGTPVDITPSELALEAFFPADAATADALHAMAGNQPNPSSTPRT